jgi:hypothetical protein
MPIWIIYEVAVWVNKFGDVLFRLSFEGSRRLTESQKITQCAAKFHGFRRQVVYLQETLVIEDESAIRVEHQNAVAHVVQGRINLGL